MSYINHRAENEHIVQVNKEEVRFRKTDVVYTLTATKTKQRSCLPVAAWLHNHQTSGTLHNNFEGVSAIKLIKHQPPDK